MIISVAHSSCKKARKEQRIPKSGEVGAPERPDSPSGAIVIDDPQRRTYCGEVMPHNAERLWREDGRLLTCTVN